MDGCTRDDNTPWPMGKMPVVNPQPTTNIHTDNALLGFKIDVLHVGRHRNIVSRPGLSDLFSPRSFPDPEVDKTAKRKNTEIYFISFLDTFYLSFQDFPREIFIIVGEEDHRNNKCG